MSGGPIIGKLSQLSVQEPLFFCVGCSFNLKLFPDGNPEGHVLYDHVIWLVVDGLYDYITGRINYNNTNSKEQVSDTAIGE